MKKIFFSLILIIISFLSDCGKNPHLEIHIIDVGQGDSILIQTPNTINILVDGGTDDSEHILKSYLKKQNIKYLDYIIATHPDSDHIGGLDSIVKNFQVKSIYMSEQSTDSLAYKNLLAACSDKNISINYLYKGDILNIEDCIDLLVLNPSFIQNENNLNSIVFKLNFKNKSFLFTGDAELSNEKDIITSFELEDVDFLKVAHHGSSSSTSMNFLNEITPDVAVISCGYKNQYGHPHRSTLDNLLNSDVITYRTDLSGDMVFYSDGEIIYTEKNYEYIK